MKRRNAEGKTEDFEAQCQEFERIREEAISEVLKANKTTEKNNLISAASDGDIDAVKAHIAAGTNVNASNGAGFTALTLAVENNHLEIVKILVANGATKDRNSLIDALPMASFGGKTEIMKAILIKANDIDDDILEDALNVCKGGYTSEIARIIKEILKERNHLYEEIHEY